jgi:hypothetical protein
MRASLEQDRGVLPLITSEIGSMDAVTEELSKLLRKMTRHLRWVGEIRVLVLFQPPQAIAEDQTRARPVTVIRAGAVGEPRGASATTRASKFRLRSSALN